MDYISIMKECVGLDTGKPLKELAVILRAKRPDLTREQQIAVLSAHCDAARNRFAAAMAEDEDSREPRHYRDWYYREHGEYPELKKPDEERKEANGSIS